MYKNNLFLITLTATLGGFSFGLDTAVISGTIPYVKEQFSLSPIQVGWFVGCALLGCIAGVALTGKLSAWFGRKTLMLISALLIAISALGCALTASFLMLIFFRILSGIGIGIASVVCPIYLSEMAPTSIRGKLVSYYQLAITIGILLAYFSNASIQTYLIGDLSSSDGNFTQLLWNEKWRAMFMVGVIPALIFLVLVFFVPESPRWLAFKSNLKLEYKKENFKKTKFSSLEDLTEPINEIRTDRVSFAELFKGYLATPMLIGISLAALSQFSGINAIIYYGPSILEKAGFTLNSAFGGQVTIGLFNMIFTFVAINLIDKSGRKPLLLWGIAGSALSLLITGILFLLNITNGWAILTCILVFISCFAFSFGPVVWVVISEIFPTSVRGEAVAISTLALWVANWLVGEFFPILNQYPAVPFFVFTSFCILAFWLTLTKIPETKGKSLEEIEKFWKN